MKRTTLYLKLISFTVPNSLVIVFVFFFLATGAVEVLAGNTVTYEGNIQGLDCVHYRKICPEDELDMYIALERDFVLLSPTGSHFLLPNIDRHIKVKYLTKPVRISGELKGTSIWVDRLEAKEGEHFKPVWNWEDQQEAEEAN